MYAFVDDLTLLDESHMNELLTLQPYTFIYEGEIRKSYEAANTAAYSLAEYGYAAKIVGWDVNDMLAWAYAGRGRIELQLDKDKEGADLVIQFRDALFNPNGSSDGNLLKEVIIPKEFLPATASWVSIPVDIALLNIDCWIVCLKAGDSWNDIKLYGDTSPNPSQPCYYRAGDSGPWVETNPLNYRIITANTGRLKHEVFSENGLATFEYEADLLSKIYTFLPSNEDTLKGVREIRTLHYDGNILLGAT